MKRTCLILLLVLNIAFMTKASREDILINENWTFRFSYQVQPNSGQRVDLPHTWNAMDALSGKQDYYRGMGNYEKQLFARPEWKDKRIYLRFEGANTVTDLFVNGAHVGEHRGGYGAFVFEITRFLKYGENNNLLVKVSNALTLDVIPLVGDFNMYGGIYRDLHLIVTDPISISLTDYASPGVYLTQKKITKELAEIQAKVVLSSAIESSQPVEIRVKVSDNQKVIQEQSIRKDISRGDNQSVEIPFTLKNPHLWNGRKDPFLYKVEVSLLSGGKEVDRIVQPLGLRFYHVDENKGFFLNGEPLKLRGVCRHQDRAERGNALWKEHHEEDAAIMAEMGVNAVRLSHYPQASYFYELMDRYGIVVWSEIPLVGPGGYADQGYVNQASFRSNGKEQLKELIRQHFNHPSICFWGLFNELKTVGDNPVEYIKELNALAHEEDPSRLTTSASFLEDENPINRISDLIAWNKYYGWYGGSPELLGQWADKVHAAYPEFRIAISEYGAGASIYHQQDSVKQGQASGWWHPENWQTYYHRENWKVISERPYIWGSFIWVMFDFGAAHRTEGDRPGVNDKGLVTADRKVKKDAYYFYKANWNNEDKFIYISGRRHRERPQGKTDIMVFSNLLSLDLYVNGIFIERQFPDAYATFQWKNVDLSKGKNEIEIRSSISKIKLQDKVVWWCR
ncbi:glycoside hydrolase family 2 protein [Parabacteroides sp. Marseille-P3160]|uniref:beta-glucuronidase LacZ4 n=1 Tax=Parabacteroides sp. Marseille-P3160 TaxID=1917887 RepID=UPI0009BA12A9|nr:glycoside hydrolase family 2 TIM barrel-domain containing protein [Parabacteroides sp. Marseille-P3160]